MYIELFSYVLKLEHSVRFEIRLLNKTEPILII